MYNLDYLYFDVVSDTPQPMDMEVEQAPPGEGYMFSLEGEPPFERVSVSFILHINYL